ncbi:hypothetical protein SAMN04488591_3122 [Microbacterium azadirachtae]|uniref:Uncharacterized protein n=1 Tax=Microbacterium azadirachtae TaxID=582680 RepID=A0A1I6IYG0_9MICO|nr:hypothetical protein [Microbacterium azadirachtae]SFR71785.1 hypothetical protein SAMN04488591_3122 [Microbacterium azadirachtae]
MTRYRYSNLSAAIRDKQSPLRVWLSEMFPNTREVQADYRKNDPVIVVDGGEANPGTLGSAFDFAMRYELKPTYDADIARYAFARDERLISEIDAVIIAAQVSRRVGDLETVYRASWALALLTEVYRAGLKPGSPLLELHAAGRLDARHLLELAPADALRQLDALVPLAKEVVGPSLGSPLVLGPTFDASELCAADADVIANGLLLDFKTSVGAKANRPGGRADRLDLNDLFQIISYALFDFSDTYKIREVGIYSARFGHLVTWNLSDLLEVLAGVPVDLGTARVRAREALS